MVSLLSPLDNYAVKRYSQAQGAMLRHRDQKMTVLTETLNGIRQIKFSTLETQWEQKINAIRDKELEAQWTVACWQLVPMSLYLITPTILSTVVMAVYALVSGKLSPATAFTAISVLNTMQNPLTAMPGVISGCIDSMVSAKRSCRIFSILQKGNLP